MAALASALMWHAVVRATNAIGAATFAWAAVVATTPFLFNSFAIYPEIPAALAAVVALTVTFGGAGPREALTQWLIVGLACAALPWFSTKYAPMSAALIAIARGPDPLAVFEQRPRGRRRQPFVARTRRRVRSSYFALDGAARAVRGVTRRLVHVLLRDLGRPLGRRRPTARWSRPAPGTSSSARPACSSIRNTVCCPMPRSTYWPLRACGRCGAIAANCGAGPSRSPSSLPHLLATVGAFRIWWGGSASPGRPLTSGLLLLALPIAMAFRSAPAGGARRAAQHLLLWLSVGIAVLALIGATGIPHHQRPRRDVLAAGVSLAAVAGLDTRPFVHPSRSANRTAPLVGVVGAGCWCGDRRRRDRERFDRARHL